MSPQDKVNEIIRRLQQAYPEAHCSLHFRNPFELLAATILSAQCTDERVNKVTPTLFEKFPDASSLAKAKQTDVERLIKSTGFFRNKAKSLIGMAIGIMEEHGGRVPETLDALVHLPGIGRKTANVVLGNAFGKAEGVVVDTHVKRLSFRLGLSKQTTPEKVEIDLNRIVPKTYWKELPHWLITHGREVCDARKPNCKACILEDLCPKRGVLTKLAPQKKLQVRAPSSKRTAR